MLRAADRRGRRRWSTALDADRGRVRADPGQIEQVIVNLAVNARDAMPERRAGSRSRPPTCGSTQASPAGTPALRPGRTCCSRCATPASAWTRRPQARIFEPFFTTKEPGKGTGLGLATVYGIVHAERRPRSASTASPASGTTFTIYLPRVDAAGRRPARRRGAAGAAPHGSETVLLVEDEPEVRALARDILHAAGLHGARGERRRARPSGSAGEHGGPIDLLLTDVVMPQMSGRELADRLLARCGRRRKVLYMSGYTDDAILHQGVSEPGIAFLPKPFTAAELARKVREVLDAAPASGAASPASPRPRPLARRPSVPARTAPISRPATAIADSNAWIVSFTSPSSWTMDR